MTRTTSLGLSWRDLGRFAVLLFLPSIMAIAYRKTPCAQSTPLHHEGNAGHPAIRKRLLDALASAVIDMPGKEVPHRAQGWQAQSAVPPKVNVAEAAKPRIPGACRRSISGRPPLSVRAPVRRARLAHRRLPALRATAVAPATCTPHPAGCGGVAPSGWQASWQDIE